jgi:alpha-beta hydrolase superfamily lysophospholipase
MEFAEAMNERGLVVQAQDHRGHGATAGDGDLGKGGWPALVADIGLLSVEIRARHPGLPLILLGHSMGSFAVQQYLLDHSVDADAVILTGTAVIDLLEPALDLDQLLDLAMFNAAFQPARTGYDWLPRDEAVSDAMSRTRARLAPGFSCPLRPIANRASSRPRSGSNYRTKASSRYSRSSGSGLAAARLRPMPSAASGSTGPARC